MKKLLAAILIGGASLMYSQTTAFEENGHSVTLGYGFPNLYKSILKATYNNGGYTNGTSSYAYSTLGSGPYFLKYEYGVTDRIAVGVVLGYYSAGVEQIYSYQDQTYNNQTGTYSYQNYKDVSTVKIINTSIGFRFNYHFGRKEKLDPYIGFAAGYSHTTAQIDFTSDNPNSNHSSLTATNPIPIYLGLTFGMRYYFTKNIGLYAEFGLDKWAVIQGGLAFKFK